MCLTQCLVDVYQYGHWPGAKGQGEYFCTEYPPLARGQGAYWRPTFQFGPSTRPPSTVPFQLVPARSKYCSKCTWDSFYPFPLSVPLFSRALKLKPNLVSFKRVLVPPSSKSFLSCFVIAAALGDFTLCPVVTM